MKLPGEYLMCMCWDPDKPEEYSTKAQSLKEHKGTKNLCSSCLGGFVVKFLLLMLEVKWSKVRESR